jgi:HEAT repeat protein
MSKSAAAELQELESLPDDADVGAVAGPLRRAFATRSPSAVARAAGLAARFKVRALESELADAFDHFLGAGVKSDRHCAAKLAIAIALRAIRSEDRDLYLRGMRHYWPARPRLGQRDQAASLRIACAEALADVGHFDLLMHLADLLGDPTPAVRVAAANLLGASGERESRSLLRLKVHCGDAASEVTDACFAALIVQDVEEAVPFIAEFLFAEDERLRTMAMLALGQSEHEGALKPLTAYWKRLKTADERDSAAVAIALLRKRSAIEFLLSLIDEGGDDAEGAIRALAAFRANLQIRGQVETAIDRADDFVLRRCFEANFRAG